MHFLSVINDVSKPFIFDKFRNLPPIHNNFAPAIVCTRGHDYKLYMRNVGIDARKHFLSSRVLQAWNHLPSNEINFDSLNMFKNSLINTDLTKYCIEIN